MNRCSSHVSAALVLIVFIIAPQFASASTTWNVADEPCEPPEGFIPIQTVEDLYAINDDLDGNYFLCNDIDLAGLNFEPIGLAPFTGVFEGNNKRIINLTMEHDLPNVGFFYRISFNSGTVRNLIFVDPRVRNRREPPMSNATGVLTGRALHLTYFPGVVENVHVVGRGYVEGRSFVGGLVGRNAGLIKGSSVSADIVVSGDTWVGGLVGATAKGSSSDWGTVNDSFSAAEVHGVSQVGGLVGSVAYGSHVARSYAAGEVFGEVHVGMLAGLVHGQFFNNVHYPGKVERSYAAILPGFEDLPLVGHCNWSCDVDVFSGLRTIEQMQTPNTPGVFVGWDFVNTWSHHNGQYPQLMEPILGDLNGDGVVDVSDLLILLGQWGNCSDCNNCPADLNNDCTVDASDLLILLANWE